MEYLNINLKSKKARTLALITVIAVAFAYLQFIIYHKHVYIDIKYRFEDTILHIEAQTNIVDGAEVNFKIRNTVTNLFFEKTAPVNDGSLKLEVNLTEFGTGYIEILPVFSVANTSQIPRLSQIYGIRGEKMRGEQIVKTSEGEKLCFPQLDAIPYPDLHSAADYTDRHLQKTLQPLLKSQSEVVRSIDKIDPQWRSFNLYFNSKWDTLTVAEKGKLIEKMYFLIYSTANIRGFNYSDDSDPILVNIYDQHNNLIVKCSDNYRYQIIE